jgi:glycosyltransferase involved in cell wall biosynthesis
VGWVAREDVKAVIDGSDMMLLPSQVESFGTIALEAMARRRLVLVSVNCGIINWPDLRKGVLVIETGESLADAIQRVTDMEVSARLKKAEHAFNAAKTFNDFTIKQWTDLFYTISEKTTSRRNDVKQIQ